MMPLKALVTGASAGLGAALHRKLATYGIRAYGTGTKVTSEMIWEFKVLTPGGLEAGVRALEKKVEEHLGGTLDFLVNNAGDTLLDKYEDVTLVNLEYLMRVNCWAPVLLTRSMLPYLQRSQRAGGPVVLNIGSDAAWKPMRCSLGYNVSKAGLEMATKQIAREITKPRGVTVLQANLGKLHGTGMSEYVDTRVPQVRNWTSDFARSYWISNSVSGRELHVQDAADFLVQVLYYADKAMSGAILNLSS